MLKRILRCTAKIIGAFVLLIVLLCASFIIINQFDETLHPEFNTFFAKTTPIPNNENGYFALQGIHAPKDLDIHAFGLQSIAEVDKTRRKKTTFSAKRPPLIEFKGNAIGLGCFDRQQTYEWEACVSDAMFQQMIADNHLLLERFRSLYRYKKFDGRLPSTVGFQLFALQELHMAQLAIESRNGNAKKALSAWIENMEFTQRLIGGHNSMIAQIVALSMRYTSIYTFPMIARYATPEQLAAVKPQLDALFTAPVFGKAGLNVEQTMVAELEASKYLDEYALPYTPRPKFSFYLPNATKNAYFLFAKDFVALSKKPASELIAAHQLFESTYRHKKTTSIFAHRFYNAAGKSVLRNVYAGSILVLIAQKSATKLHLLKLYTEAKIAGIEPKNMPDFIEKAPASMRNPFTNKPFEWDAEKQTITYIFVMPEGQDSFKVVY